MNNWRVYGGVSMGTCLPSNLLENSIRLLYYSRNDTIFKNIYQVVKEFVKIPVTNYLRERHFLKLSFIKTKLKTSMLQDRLLAKYCTKSAYNININVIIETSRIFIVT